MTREEAEEINRREWEEERADLIQRALAYSKAKRAEERTRLLGVFVEQTPGQSAPFTNLTAARFSIDGEEKTISQWAMAYGMDEKLLRQRLWLGWNLKRALTTAPYIKHRPAVGGSKPRLFYTAFGETLSLVEWSRRSGVNYMTIKGRLRNGMSFEEAITYNRKAAVSNECNDGGGEGRTFSNRPGTGVGSHARESAEMGISTQ